MTNLLHITLLASLLSLIAGCIGVYFLRAHITSEFNRLETVVHSRADHVVVSLVNVERSLRSHVIDEINGVTGHITEETRNVENNVLDFVKTHADELSAAAAAIKAHSIETHDRAVSRDISPRQAVTRT